MKKRKSLNSKGFMLMETLLVSLTIAGILVYMYVQFSNISNSYSRATRYNTVEGLYHADVIKHYLMINTFYEIPGTSSGDPLYVAPNGINVTGPRVIADCSTPGSNCSCNIPIINADTHKRQGARINYFCKLVKELDLNYVILASGEALYPTYPKQSAALSNFMKTLSAGTADEYRIVVEYKDGSFASLLYTLPGAE